jgi:hypothetical protein
MCLVNAALAMLIAMAFLPACGRSAQADPFVGTWSLQPSHGRVMPELFVIAKMADGYVATRFFKGSVGPASPAPTPAIRLTRQGDRLVGTYMVGNDTFRLEIAYVPQKDELAWAYSPSPTGPLNNPLTAIRVSHATTIPPPSP